MTETNPAGERVGRVEARMDPFEDKLNRVVDVVDRISQTIHRPTPHQWGPILAAVGLVAGFAAGYTTIIASPITNRQNENSEDIDTLESELFRINYIIGGLEERSIRQAEHARDVDLYGSRRWVEQSNKAGDKK